MAVAEEQLSKSKHIGQPSRVVGAVLAARLAEVAEGLVCEVELACCLLVERIDLFLI